MSLFIPTPSGALRLALSLASQQFGPMVATARFYMLVSNQDLYYTQAVGGATATAGNGSIFLPAKTIGVILPGNGLNLAVLGLVAGDVTLSPADYVRG